MARRPTTSDPFNAIAEPRRRALLERFHGRERSVGELVDELGWPQPMVSKHLGVLKEVGLVRMRKKGRQRLYRMDAEKLKPIVEWVIPFRQYWSESFEKLDDLLAEIQHKER